MEKEVGEIFQFNNKILIVEKSCICDNCFVLQSNEVNFCMDMNDIGGECQGKYRTDNTTIIFKEVIK